MREFNVNKYIGIPWKRRGRDLSGMDCWGLFSYVYENEFGIKFENQYPLTPGKHTRQIAKAFKEAITGHDWTKTYQPEFGCAVALSQNERIHHVGIYVEGGCLHSTEIAGSVFHTKMHLRLSGYSKIEYYKYIPVRADHV